MKAVASMTRARDAWGAAMPAWVKALAEECDRTSQEKAARRIGTTGSTINMVLGKKYRAGTDRIERKVRALLMHETCHCPFYRAEIRKADCDTWRARKSPTYSPQAFRLWQSCQTCLENQQITSDARSKTC